jgi:hypothetical protein
MADSGRFITVDLAGSIAPGQRVYDRLGDRVGVVDAVDQAKGWMDVETNPLSHRGLVVPFHLITSVDQRELYLSLRREELERDFAEPPPRTTVVTRLGDRTMARTTQPSGYDGTPIVVRETDVDEFKNRIAVGDEVWTADLVQVGQVKDYDPGTGYMRIGETRPFSKQDLFVPITLVDSVTVAPPRIALIASQSDLRRMTHLEALNVVTLSHGSGPTT